MARIARVVAVGLPHHITQRGKGRRDVFVNDDLKHIYLDLLREQAANYRLRILGYCLMTNHLHLVAIPEAEHSMAGTLRHAHGRFAQYWNTARGGVGHMAEPLLLVRARGRARLGRAAVCGTESGARRDGRRGGWLPVVQRGGACEWSRPKPDAGYELVARRVDRGRLESGAPNGYRKHGRGRHSAGDL